MRRPTRPRQCDFVFKAWGGARKGAGRKPVGERAGVSHRTRPRINANLPAHVTLKMKRGIWHLRTPKPFATVLCAIKSASNTCFRVCEFSVQCDHIHLLVEADDNLSLARGVQGLSVRIARGLNRVMRRTGKVLRDRFHARLLNTPREVKLALAYVLRNGARHLAQRGRAVQPFWLDPYSSAASFKGWSVDIVAPTSGIIALSAPISWLLRCGWKKAGLIDPWITSIA
jgi:REP element-mobilizing transposase RayT